ncbi:hypothetical protein MBLNU230_g1249t1 [Neophaeotheca triangularis]
MSLYNVDPKPVTEPNDTEVNEWARTPPETVADDLLGAEDPLGDSIRSTSVPWPGSTFILRCITTGRLLTLLDGSIILASPGSGGSYHWECIEHKGWLAFRSRISGRFLGHNKNGRLVCTADKQQGWENFTVRPTPEGSYLLFMTHHERLWRVGLKLEEGGVEKLFKMNAADAREAAIEWDFIKA